MAGNNENENFGHHNEDVQASSTGQVDDARGQMVYTEEEQELPSYRYDEEEASLALESQQSNMGYNSAVQVDGNHHATGVSASNDSLHDSNSRIIIEDSNSPQQRPAANRVLSGLVRRRSDVSTFYSGISSILSGTSSSYCLSISSDQSNSESQSQYQVGSGSSIHYHHQGDNNSSSGSINNSPPLEQVQLPRVQQGKKSPSMSTEKQKQVRAHIKAILADKTLQPVERRRSIQFLMDGRRNKNSTFNTYFNSNSKIMTSSRRSSSSNSHNFSGRSSELSICSSPPRTPHDVGETPASIEVSGSASLTEDSLNITHNLDRKSPHNGTNNVTNKNSNNNQDEGSDFEIAQNHNTQNSDDLQCLLIPPDTTKDISKKFQTREQTTLEKALPLYNTPGKKFGDNDNGSPSSSRSHKNQSKSSKNFLYTQTGLFYCQPTERSKRAELSRPKCKHYVRNCTIIAPCCEGAFGCRLCHDECPVLPPLISSYDCQKVDTTRRNGTKSIRSSRKYQRSSSMPAVMGSSKIEHHTIDRFAIKEIICRNCFSRQTSKTNSCLNCKIQFGEYHCKKCNLWMSSEEDPYHCDDCGFCRVGGASNFRHCHDCGMCVDAEKFEEHNCKVGQYMNDCPVCREDLFSSRNASHEMPCGHVIHWHCFKQLANHDSRCPICKKTAVTPEHMALTWNALALGIVLQPLPPDMTKAVDINCIDCKAKDTNRRWHFLGTHCGKCGSFNTLIEKVVKTGVEAHRFLEGQDEPEHSYQSSLTLPTNGFNLV